MKRGLTRLVPWAQQLLAEVLQPGDLAVDLTAGSGRDTLFLAEKVGPSGTVLAFDIQADALAQTKTLLSSHQLYGQLHNGTDLPSDLPAGIHLLLSSHTNFCDFLPAAPAAIIANLGYLPGSDGRVTTERVTTLPTLEKSLRVLKPGGRIAVVAYVGHPGGRGEADGVAELLANLPPEGWKVLRLSIENIPHAPCLFIAEKQRE